MQLHPGVIEEELKMNADSNISVDLKPRLFFGKAQLRAEGKQKGSLHIQRNDGELTTEGGRSPWFHVASLCGISAEWRSTLCRSKDNDNYFHLHTYKAILKEINPEYSLEGLMLKLKLRYFGHLMQRANSLEKTLVLERLRATEDEMVGWPHWLNGREFEQGPGGGEGPGRLACCSPWGRRVSRDWASNKAAFPPLSV